MLQKLLKVQIGLLTFAIGFVSVAGYDFAKSIKIPRIDEVVHVREPLKTSNGREIDVQVSVIGSRRARVKVKNISSDVVYLPYLRTDTNEAFYAVLGLEKLDRETGVFEQFEGGDFAPGLHPLFPGEFFTDEMYLDRGTYRVNFYPLLDRELRQRIHRFGFMMHMDNLREEWDAELDAIGEEIDRLGTPPITVEFELPTKTRSRDASPKKRRND